MTSKVRARRVAPVDHDPAELRRIRLDRGMSQAELARQVDVTRSVICEAEADAPTRGLSPQLRFRLNGVLRIELTRIERAPDRQPEMAA